MPYWITETLNALPIYLLVYFGLGIPWALVILPQRDRSDFATLLPVGFLCGAGLITMWMFVLGTVGASLNQPMFMPENIVAGGVVLALIAIGVIAIRLSRAGRPYSPPFSVRSSKTIERLLVDEWLLILLIVVAVIVAAAVTAYWTFTAYDALWVYGYEARVYALTGYIPQTIGYYPQFLPLQYTLAQLGGINDHAARAVVPLLHIGTIFAVYVLGKFTAGRRAGLFAAALWALYPHVGEWSRAGDLEIPLTFSFTLAAAFFLRAWMNAVLRAGEITNVRNGVSVEPRFANTVRRDAALAGLFFGVALWTKPTAGAFALGVALMVVLEFVRLVSQIQAAGIISRLRNPQLWMLFRPRFEVALITALACAPLGGVWYIRNALLGHNPVDFPPGYWQTLAEQGGDDFGFLLLAILLVVAYLWAHFKEARRVAVLIGLALIFAAVSRSILVEGLTLEAHRMTLIEIVVLIAGFAVLYRTLAHDFLRRLKSSPEKTGLLEDAQRIGWAQVLALPYFVVWFYAYSYHYRLSFAVVPLLLLPTAVILARWISPQWVQKTRLKPVYLLALVALAIPGIYSPIPDKFAGAEYLFDDSLPNDDARIRSGNAALMTVVDGLQVWKNEHPGEQLVVVAPGIDPLPFFFPLDDIRVSDAPTRLSDIEDAHYLVYGLPETRGEYEPVPFFENQVVGALGRLDVMRRAWGSDDGIFRYDVYELNVDQRWVRPEPLGMASDDVVFGGFARYVGYDLGGLELWAGRRIIQHLIFEVIAPPPADYSIYVHLLDQDGELITSWDNPAARTETGYYSTLMWEPGEFINDERVLSLPDGVAPIGEGYRLVIGFYVVDGNERVPVTVNGEPAGDGYEIQSQFSIVPPRN